MGSYGTLSLEFKEMKMNPSVLAISTLFSLVNYCRWY
jgi:hypothetical protein